MNRNALYVVGSVTVTSALGAFTADGVGAVAGAVCGAMTGFVFFPSSKRISRPPKQRTPKYIRERIVCVPEGEVADCVFQLNRRSGRWVDVRSCSLCDPATEVLCEKQCLTLMNAYDSELLQSRGEPLSRVTPRG